MTATVSPSLETIFIKLQALIMGLIDCEVVRGQQNGVPMPVGPFISMTEVLQKRLSTNVSAYNDPGTNGTNAVMQPTQYAIQIDCYGPDSGDWATILTTMFRDPYGCDQLGPEVSPFYADDPMQSPLINGEENYEARWIITAVMQCNFVVTVSQQFAGALAATLIEVDATFPP